MNTDAFVVEPPQALSAGAQHMPPVAELDHWAPRAVRPANQDSALATVGDHELMERFQSKGDYTAFEALFTRHRNSLLGFLQRLSADRNVAEDVSQWTWMRVIETGRRHGFAPRATATFPTWLFTLARNRFVDEYLRRADVARVIPFPDGMTERLAADDSGGAQEHYVNAEQLHGHIERALHELPFQQREVLALWSSGFDAETIARLTEAPRDTVLSRKKYALAKLRAALADLGVTEN